MRVFDLLPISQHVPYKKSSSDGKMFSLSPDIRMCVGLYACEQVCVCVCVCVHVFM